MQHPAPLAQGQSLETTVQARLPWNATGAYLLRGHRYRLSVPPGQTWLDAHIESGPEGQPGQGIQRLAGWLRRAPFPWFALVGAIGPDGPPFLIGSGVAEFRPAADGELLCYANDARLFYGNNHGTMRLLITRLE
ncbi:hypothetical protein F0P96_11200 [Hymenobacter busanensis]|uniref:Uncharacterized protein n=1 Tax=Hymenobacter busanensis TaxID=2607656 RepID=A0A7L4ZWK7_9BACT|nr:hypothetical protein [Hymenobacter busanensis]KAA9332051.1 hypothetical protein F0P96_11200 [Hymenobacter busanensis]QHJ07611.1 hypothetical protein GUY19_10075 [Hymenobacter busanensis]